MPRESVICKQKRVGFELNESEQTGVENGDGSSSKGEADENASDDDEPLDDAAGNGD